MHIPPDETLRDGASGRQSFSVLVEGVDGEAAEEFGVEVGGFLRHDFAGEGDVLELVEGDGLDEEGDVGFAGFDERDGFAGLAEVLDVAGGADLVFGEAEEVVENDGVELGDAELALSWAVDLREVGRWLRVWG